MHEPPTVTRSPVAMLIFNRPAETARVFAAVREARPAQLLVVADGPRAELRGEDALVDAARAAVADVDWPCEVARLYSDENLGCGERVMSGLDWVFDSVPEAIVLEDDCLPHPDFFSFADTMLERYRADERVGMIAGTNYFSDPTRAADSFFTRYFAIWGWASWRRAWSTYDRSMEGWPAMRDARTHESLVGHAGLAGFLAEMFDAAHRGEIDTWDIQWLYSNLVRRALCVVPRVNLVSNIGFEGTRPPGPNLGMATAPWIPTVDGADLQVVPDQDYENRLFDERLQAPPAPAGGRVGAVVRSLAHRIASS